MRRLLILALVLAACGDTHIDSEGPGRPEPPQPPVGEMVRSLTVDETTFSLFDEGDGCVAVEAATPGLQSGVDRWCPHDDYPLTGTEPCGWYRNETLSEGRGCDALLPTVLFGRVTSNDVAWVCTATMPEDTGVAGVRFLEYDDDGFILEEARPDETQVAHLFDFNGARYGSPQLDAPSGWIYEACEREAPWDGAGVSYGATLTLRLDRALQRSDVVIFMDAGLGDEGVAGDASGESVIEIFLRIGAHSDGLELRIEAPESTEVFSVALPWPDELQRLVSSDTECADLVILDLVLGATALEGDPNSVQLTVQDRPCPSL
ncbi:MAG: hypothetical protein QNJ89_02945 [Acidimicrobiia bacterium]|nr:hypothetical protein [Acidimicrobiia bacterium]